MLIAAVLTGLVGFLIVVAIISTFWSRKKLDAGCGRRDEPVRDGLSPPGSRSLPPPLVHAPCRGGPLRPRHPGLRPYPLGTGACAGLGTRPGSRPGAAFLPALDERTPSRWTSPPARPSRRPLLPTWRKSSASRPFGSGSNGMDLLVELQLGRRGPKPPPRPGPNGLLAGSRRDRDRAQRPPRGRFRLPVLRPLARCSGRSRHRLRPLRSWPVLGRSPGPNGAGRLSILGARRVRGSLLSERPGPLSGRAVTVLRCELLSPPA